MTANPFTDQLAAQVRERSADRPEPVTKLATYIADQLSQQLPGLPDQDIGAVLLTVAGAAMSLAVEFHFDAIAVANGIAVAGENLYHRPAPARPDPAAALDTPVPYRFDVHRRACCTECGTPVAAAEMLSVPRDADLELVGDGDGVRAVVTFRGSAFTLQPCGHVTTAGGAA